LENWYWFDKFYPGDDFLIPIRELGQPVWLKPKKRHFKIQGTALFGQPHEYYTQLGLYFGI
jgi:hypothetical protein